MTPAVPAVETAVGSNRNILVMLGYREKEKGTTVKRQSDGAHPSRSG